MTYNLKARKGGCLGTFLIIILLVIVLAVGAVIFCFNSTPEAIGLGGISLGGNNTVSSIGLGQIKISELWTLFKSLGKGVYTYSDDQAPTQADATSADTMAEQWNLGKKGDDVYYAKLFVQYPAVCDAAAINPLAQNNYTLTAQQTAYVFNSALSQFYTDSKVIVDIAEASGIQSLKDLVATLEILQNLDVSICAMRFVGDGNGITMKLAVSVDVSDYVKELNIPFVQLANVVYADFDVKATVDSDGKLQGTFSSVSVNGNNRDTSLAVLDAVFKVLATDGEPLTTSQICGYATTAISYLCQRIGCIQNIDLANGTIKFVSAAEHLVG